MLVNTNGICITSILIVSNGTIHVGTILEALVLYPKTTPSLIICSLSSQSSRRKIPHGLILRMPRLHNQTLPLHAAHQPKHVALLLLLL